MQSCLVCFQVNILCFFVQFCDSCYQHDKVLRMTKILIVTNIAADIIPLVYAGASIEDDMMGYIHTGLKEGFCLKLLSI